MGWNSFKAETFKMENSSFEFQQHKGHYLQVWCCSTVFYNLFAFIVPLRSLFKHFFWLAPRHGILMLQLYYIVIYVYLCFVHKENKIFFLPLKTNFLPLGGNITLIDSACCNGKIEIAHILIFIKSSAYISIWFGKWQ